MDTKKLRQKILDLAIRGKLVPQDPNDEPASVLLERIQAEKERLIKEGKIKRSKKSASDTPHYENEVPFEVPKGWEWTRLEDFVYAVTDGDHLPPPKSPSGVPFLVISDVNTGRISFDKARYAEKDYYNSLPEIRKAVKGDILFTVTGSYGIVIPVETERQFCFQRHIGLIKTLTSSLWLTIALQSDYVLSYCDKVATGTAQKTVSLAHLRDLLIPIPPQREQERINEELSKWLDAVNNISSNNERLSCAIDKTKSKILDLAIHGKLVPQDPNDEPAIELLKRINPKFTPCDNAHDTNQLPNSWCWTTLGNIGKWQSGATPSRLNKEFYGGDIPWLKTGDLNDGYIYDIPETITQKALEESSVKLNPTGSVLIAMYGATIGKVGILTFPATTNQACCACVDYQGIEQLYLFYFLLSHKEEFIMLGGGGAQPNISKEKIVETLFPLPPYNEQLRIVAKIEELFGVLDEIQKSIEA